MRKNGFLSLVGNFAKDKDGNVAIFLTLTLPVIIGMIGLVLDGGALIHLNSDLQELADAAAIAGAAELDGASDAIDRATDKAEHLLNNDPHWSNVARSGVQITTPTFYSKLSVDPVTKKPTDTPTTNPAQARFIKVTTVTRERAVSFLAAVGAAANAQTSASAVAGSITIACNVQPLMLCNPYEANNPPSDFNATPGQLFHFKQKGNTGGFSPGDFGLLDPPGVNSAGAKTIRNLLSKQSPNFCYVNEVSPRPGQIAGDVADAINVRFDLTPNGNTTGLDQTPAPNVIKGIMTDPSKPLDACKSSKYDMDQWPSPPSPASTIPPNVLPNGTPNTAQLPLATDMTPTPPVSILDIGNTMDSVAANAYWNYHHGANWPAVGGTPITRFQAYCQERGLGNDCQGSNSPQTWDANSEPNAPQCSPASAGDYKRRLISVAVINCLAQEVQGNQATNVRSNEYAVFFLTSPSPTSQPGALNNYLGSATNGDILAEFVETITPAGCAANPTNPFCNGLHQVVQLYR
jgi:Flp pilus assembly protein TadG